MQTEVINIGLAFLEGLALIISPCILPILPLILSGSIEGSKKRPFGIILGFIITFALFTFFSRKLVQYTGIDLGLIRHISYALLLLFGIMMLSTYLTEEFNRITQRLTRIGSRLADVNNPQGGFISGIFFGCLVGIIWTPCAGPILAAVIVQTVIQQTSLNSFLTVLSFGIGAAIPMLVITLFGRKIMTKFSFFKTHTKQLRKTLGAIIIIAVVYMIYSEGGISPSFAKSDQKAIKQNKIVNGISNPYIAPAIADVAAWLNSPPLELNQLKGKVVLIDFWTYSCINCVRTFPYLKEWYNKYHDKGLVIIGIHAPEFEFEKDFNNVKKAIEKNNIQYPVALDNQFSTWQNFQNRYWPAHYLIDKNGYVVYLHFGEGEYDVTENNIRYLLGMNAEKKSIKEAEQYYENETPETYLGFTRADRYRSPEKVMEGIASQYSYPTELAIDDWALQGRWNVGPDKITSAEANAAIKIHFNATKVYAVMGNATGKPISVKLSLNDQPVISEKGKDVVDSSINVDKYTIYEVLILKEYGGDILQLTAAEPGLEIYTFTFG